MLPLYPPYPFVDLAHEHLAGRQPKHRALNRHDPEGFLSDIPALQPDPVFMGLRALMTRGPIGALVRLIERRIEAREDRRVEADVSAETVAEPSQMPDREAQADRTIAV